MTSQDPMHIFLEGFARRLVLDFIKVWSQTKLTTLEELNMRIHNFNWNFIYQNDRLKLSLNESALTKMNQLFHQTKNAFCSIFSRSFSVTYAI